MFCRKSCYSLKSHGPVHEVEIQVGETQVGQTGPACLFNILGIMFGVPEFGSHKHLVTRQSLGSRGQITVDFWRNRIGFLS